MKTTVEIKKMGINGEGIGYINRKVVFVKGALLGETVEVDAQQYKNKNYYFGDLIRVVQASPMRVKNPCRANKECMGCNLLHYAYPAQLKHKKDLIKESLKKYTELDRSQIKIHDIVGMNQLALAGRITSLVLFRTNQDGQDTVLWHFNLRHRTWCIYLNWLILYESRGEHEEGKQQGHNV